MASDQLQWAHGLPPVQGLLFQLVVTVSFCTTATRDLVAQLFQIEKQVSTSTVCLCLPSLRHSSVKLARMPDVSADSPRHA